MESFMTCTLMSVQTIAQELQLPEDVITQLITKLTEVSSQKFTNDSLSTPCASYGYGMIH